MRRQHSALLLFLGVFFLPALVPRSEHFMRSPTISGVVTDTQGPVAQARVRWQAQPTAALSAADGSFQLPAPPHGAKRITASKPGHRITSGSPGKRSTLVLRLEALPETDNDDYAWQSPHPDARNAARCGSCHAEIYREWSASAHAHSARNRKFLELFADPDGKSPPGWDLSREHPLGMPICATCHAPTLDDEPRSGIRQNSASGKLNSGEFRNATGVAADGVHCDFCHKVVDVPTDKLGTRFGRDGMALLRPKNGDQLFYGPLDDAVRPGESFAHLPLYKESRYCASCHEGTVFGVHVYGTYSEWLESPAKAQGIECQGCHMAPTGQMTNIAPGKGGIERKPATLASHGFPGSQTEMLRRSVQADAVRRQQDGVVYVDVTLRAERVGHRVPTGFIDRHLLLVVEAFDDSGASVKPSAGPLLPRAAGNFAGRPGWLYAKLLEDENGKSPQPFWIPGAEMRDTRLAPGRTDQRSFSFPAGTARVDVKLWYRRFWHAVAAARGWQDNDTLIWSATL